MTSPSRQETCLVTGVAGFVGSHLAEALVACGYNVKGCIHYHPRQPGDAAHTAADTTSAQMELGFQASFALADGLHKEVTWLAEMLAVSKG